MTLPDWMIIGLGAFGALLIVTLIRIERHLEAIRGHLVPPSQPDEYIEP